MSLVIPRTIFRKGLNERELCRRILKSVGQCCPQTEIRYACIPLMNIPRQYFHHQKIIQFHIQTSHGILFEALQKSGFSKSDIRDIKIPDELKRLKAGSLKWIFEFWPSPTTNLPSSASYHHGKVGGGNELGLGGTKKAPSSLPKKTDEKQLHQMVEYLKRKKFPIRRLIKLPWLLSADPAIVEAAVKRVQEILQLDDFVVAISFVNLRQEKLSEAAVVWEGEKCNLSRLAKDAQGEEGSDTLEFRNRIDYLAHRLQCSKEDVSDMMSKVKSLMILPVDHIEKVLQCLLEGGIKPVGVISDPWIFIHNLETMHRRLRIVNENGITNLKPWILRTPQAVFDRFVAKNRQEIELLRDKKGIRDFLQEKLNCDEKATSTMLTKVPSIKKASAAKLNEMIEFLYSSGFTAKQICGTPRILAHSVETVSARLEEMTAYGTPVTNLHILCRTTKDYRMSLRKLRIEAEENFLIAKEPKLN